MTLRTLAMVAALWLACAASALAQTNIYNGTRDGGEQPSTGEDIGTGGGGDTPVNPGGGGGTGTDQPFDPSTGGGSDEYSSTKDINTVSDLSNACEQTTGNEDILYILQTNITTGIVFTVESCLKLDLNGYSITCSSQKCFDISDNATLMIVDRSTRVQKGSVICTHDVVSYAIFINIGGKLIADGVTITSANCMAIVNDRATAEITGCTVSGDLGIRNTGATTITGGSISGNETAILNEGGAISINTGENPAACSISGADYCIQNGSNGTVTLGSGVSIANYTNSGISHNDGTFILNAWPTFSAGSAAGVPDIYLPSGKIINIGSAITAAPAKRITVRLTDNFGKDLTAADLPVTITSGYASHITDGSSNVIDPAEVFTYYKSDAGFTFALGGDNKSEAILTVDPSTLPVGYDLTSILSPSPVEGTEPTWEFEMPDYDVLVTVVYDYLFDPVTFAFAEGQEWMTWCSEASFKKPDGIDAYTIDDATAEAITVTPITASDASQPAVLPAYTPLLLRKNGAEGLTAEQYAVPTAPTDDLFKDYGIVSHATTDCTVFGSTKAVTDAASSQVFALGRTYMLKSGEFVAVDQFDGIAANRCWLTLSGTPAASRLLIRTGDATDIRTVGPGPAPSDDHWYSLTGIRLEKRPDRKGIYLNGGKKVIIK